VEKLLLKIFGPIIKPIISEIRNRIKQLKKLPMTIMQKLAQLVRDIWNKKEPSVEDYLAIGNRLIAKKLLVIVLLVILVLTFVFYKFTPIVTTKIMGYKILHMADKQALTYSGKVKLYNELDELIYEGDLLSGVYSGYGKLYDQNQRLIYEGQFKNVALK